MSNFEEKALIEISSIEKNKKRKKKNKKVIQENIEKEGDELIVMKNVDLTLGSQLSLKQIDFVLRKGSRAALVGASGTGKHSLIDLIMGIYQRDEG